MSVQTTSPLQNNSEIGTDQSSSLQKSTLSIANESIGKAVMAARARRAARDLPPAYSQSSGQSYGASPIKITPPSLAPPPYSESQIASRQAVAIEHGLILSLEGHIEAISISREAIPTVSHQSVSVDPDAFVRQVKQSIETPPEPLAEALEPPKRDYQQLIAFQIQEPQTIINSNPLDLPSDKIQELIADIPKKVKSNRNLLAESRWYLEVPEATIQELESLNKGLRGHVHLLKQILIIREHQHLINIQIQEAERILNRDISHLSIQEQQNFIDQITPIVLNEVEFNKKFLSELKKHGIPEIDGGIIQLEALNNRLAGRINILQQNLISHSNIKIIIFVAFVLFPITLVGIIICFLLWFFNLIPS